MRNIDKLEKIQIDFTKLKLKNLQKVQVYAHGLSALYFNTRKMEKEKLPQEENINGKIVKEFFTSFGPSDKVPAEVSL